MLLYSGMVFTDSKGYESIVKLSTSGQNIAFNPSTPMDIQDRISIQDKWWELRKIWIRKSLVDQIPNSQY